MVQDSPIQQELDLAQSLLDIAPRLVRRLNADVPLYNEAPEGSGDLQEAISELRATPGQLTLLRAIETPLMPTEGYCLAGGIGITPILRAGLGLAEGFREVIPDAQIWHLGLRRDERTLQAMEYYNRLPHKVDLQVCYAVDPMLATGGSAIDAINILKQRKIQRISYIGIIAAPYGVQKLVQEHPDIEIYIAALDERLNDVGYIVPGLGDAGDRQFGTF